MEDFINFEGAFLVIHKDSDTIRKQKIKQYSSNQKSLDKELAKKERFINLDFPAFKTWVATRFAKKYEKLSEMRSEFEKLEELVRATEHYRNCTNFSWKKSYEDVLLAQKNGVLFELIRKFDKTVDREETFDLDNDEQDAEFFAEFVRRFEERDHPREQSAEQEKSDAQTTEDYAKVLHRDLVRKLHPDFNPVLSDEQKSQWHEVQTAYRDRNISKLQRLSDELNGKEAKGFDLDTIPIGDIIKLTAAIKKKLNRLRRELKLNKSDPMWDFTARKNDMKHLRRLEDIISQDLFLSEMQFQGAIQDFKKQIDKWSRGDSNKRRPDRYSDGEFYF